MYAYARSQREILQQSCSHIHTLPGGGDSPNNSLWAPQTSAKPNKPKFQSHITYGDEYKKHVMKPFKDQNSVSKLFSKRLEWIKSVISILECTSTEGKQPGPPPPYKVTVEIGQFYPS